MLALSVAGVVVGILVGLLRGGSLADVRADHVRAKWAAVVALGVQFALFLWGLDSVLGPWTAVVHVACLLLLAWCMVQNLRVPGLPLFFLGLSLQILVITANGGFIPVLPEAVVIAAGEDLLQAFRSAGRIQKSFLATPDTPLWFLGDVIPVPLVGKVYNVGDFLLAIGAAWAIAAAMQPARRAASTSTPEPA